MKIVKPHRISRSFIQHINGSIKEIMPLYCPIKEIDWCENWNPKMVYSYSGLVEKDCIFITPYEETDVLWIVTDYNIKSGHAEMFYHLPGVLVTKLEIQIKTITKCKTKAVLTYSKTSLSEAGDRILGEFTKEMFDIMMTSWEMAMNHYLKTGTKLTGLPHF